MIRQSKLVLPFLLVLLLFIILVILISLSAALFLFQVVFCYINTALTLFFFFYAHQALTAAVKDLSKSKSKLEKVKTICPKISELARTMHRDLKANAT